VIKNIGAGGLFIRTSRKVAEGQPIVLEFPLFRFDNAIRVSGKVVRRDADGFAVAFDELLDALESKNGQLPEIVHEINRSP
jgi:Tfp pilus assembly protein PilZ